MATIGDLHLMAVMPLPTCRQSTTHSKGAFGMGIPHLFNNWMNPLHPRIELFNRFATRACKNF